MARVDDGELEMLLDGALHLLDPDRAEVVRRYVETDEGRERLDEARRLRERADAILGGAASQDSGGGGLHGPVPDFAEIRARAAAARNAGTGGTGGGSGGAGRVDPGVPRRSSSLWAASIAAALVVGWMGRGLLPGGGGPLDEVDQVASEAMRGAASPANPSPSVTAPPSGPSLPATPAPPADVAPSTGPGMPAPAPGRVDEPTLAAATPPPSAQAASAFPAEAMADVLPAPASVQDAFQGQVAGEPAFKVALDPLSPPLSWPPGWETSAPPVAELAVLDVVSRGDTTVVVQALPDNGVLELRYLVTALAVDEIVPTGLGDFSRMRAETVAPSAPPAARTGEQPGAQAADVVARGAAPPAPVAAAPAPALESAEARRVVGQGLDTLDPGGGSPTTSLRVVFVGGAVELRGPVPDSVLARWGEEVALRRMRGGR